MLKHHLLLGADVHALVIGGAFVKTIELSQQDAKRRRAELERQAREQVDQKLADALPNARSDWRGTLPLVRAGVDGHVRAELTRQEVRAGERQMAKTEASLQKIAARREAKLLRKRRRAGLA